MMSSSRELSVRAEVYDNVEVVSTLYCILHRKVDVIPLQCSLDETGREKKGGKSRVDRITRRDSGSQTPLYPP